MSAPITIPAEIAFSLEAPRAGESRPAVLGADCPICPSVGRCEACRELDRLEAEAKALLGEGAEIVPVENHTFRPFLGRCNAAEGPVPTAPTGWVAAPTTWEVRSPLRVRSNRPAYKMTRGCGRTPREALESARRAGAR